VKNRTKILIAGLMALACANAAYAASTIQSFAQDAGPAIQVYNGDADENLVVVVQTAGAGAANTFTIGSTVNTLDGSGATDTVTEWVALINTYTNSGGFLVLEGRHDTSLAADSTDNELLSGTYTALPGRWVTLPWDTSVVAGVSYSNGYRSNDAKATITPNYILDHIYGSLGGTGALTLTVYLDEVQVYSKVVGSPGEPELLDIDLNIPVKPSQKLSVQAAFATSGTTGNIAIVTKSEDP
jgi:hypothetical protein